MSIGLPKIALGEEYFDSLLEVLNRSQGNCDVYLNMTVDELDLSIMSLPLKIQGTRRLQAELEAKGCTVEWR